MSLYSKEEKEKIKDRFALYGSCKEDKRIGWIKWSVRRHVYYNPVKPKHELSQCFLELRKRRCSIGFYILTHGMVTDAQYYI